jgi:hypothetical protein
MVHSFKTGRPRKEAEERRDQWLTPVRLTAGELNSVREQAAALKLKLPQYVRTKLLGSPKLLTQLQPLPDEIQQMFNDLLKLSGLLLHLSHKVTADDLYHSRMRQASLEVADLVSRSRTFVQTRLANQMGDAKRHRIETLIELLSCQFDELNLESETKMNLVAQLHLIRQEINTGAL